MPTAAVGHPRRRRICRRIRAVCADFFRSFHVIQTAWASTCRPIPSPLLNLRFKFSHSPQSPAPQGIPAPRRASRGLPGLHDPLSSCYYVPRSNSNPPSFAFNPPCVAMRGAHRVEQFLYKKACRSRREIVALITGLFRAKPFSGAPAVSNRCRVLMHLPPFHGHAGANNQQYLDQCNSATCALSMRARRFLSASPCPAVTALPPARARFAKLHFPQHPWRNVHARFHEFRRSHWSFHLDRFQQRLLAT